MFKDRKVLVVGLGKSGLGAVKLLKALGARIIASELQSPSEETLKKLGNGIFLQTGRHSPELVEEADTIVLSPGIGPDNPMVKRAEALGKKIISEIELAWQVGSVYVKDWIGITGTNGKSTTTTLVDLMLRASGIEVITGGNIGIAISELIDENLLYQKEKPPRWINIEVSSFQLERIETFRPRISAILNISEDHLDRYPDMDSYIRAKARIWKNQSEGDFIVINNDDPILRKLVPPEAVRIYRFSRTSEVEGAFMRQGQIFLRIAQKEVSIVAGEELSIKGLHNQENAMAASLIAYLAGASVEAIRDVLKSFPGLPHRMQFVGEIGGVRFYDDSKATNVDSVIRSVESFSSPVVLILGGQDKGLDFRPLRRLKQIKTVVAIGEAIPKILAHLDGHLQVFPVSGMETAVKVAYSLAQAGDVVLLSPGCASFDMFRDYAHRGRVFQEAINSIKGEVEVAKER